MKQSAQQDDHSLSWKQEVNRRVAEHKERKGGATNEPLANPEAHPAPGSRAAETARRVAERYAKAPSYNDMLAEEARAAVRAAEAASKAALEAQAAAEQVLAGLEAASSSPQTRREPEYSRAAEPVSAARPTADSTRTAAPAAHASNPASAGQIFEIRWDADMPVREAEPAGSRASQGNTFPASAAGNAWQPGLDVHGPLETEGFEVVEPAQPIHANLIEFPRELVATRKVRPRRAEGPHAASAEQLQLSIFEVDPGSISTEPAAAGAMAAAGTASWTGPEWSGITLDEEPQVEFASYAAAAPATVDWAQPNAAAVAIQPAHINRRVMAAMVDFSLITATFLGTALTVLSRLSALPAMKVMEAESVAGMAIVAVLYLVFFFALGNATPGMMYANLELRTLRGGKPSRSQRMGRMGALILSLLPVGLGVALALFDDQQLCWHDRLSGTYPRKG